MGHEGKTRLGCLSKPFDALLQQRSAIGCHFHMMQWISGYIYHCDVLLLCLYNKASVCTQTSINVTEQFVHQKDLSKIPTQLQAHGTHEIAPSGVHRHVAVWPEHPLKFQIGVLFCLVIHMSTCWFPWYLLCPVQFVFQFLLSQLFSLSHYSHINRDLCWKHFPFIDS